MLSDKIPNKNIPITNEFLKAANMSMAQISKMNLKLLPEAKIKTVQDLANHLDVCSQQHNGKEIYKSKKAVNKDLENAT